VGAGPLIPFLPAGLAEEEDRFLLQFNGKNRVEKSERWYDENFGEAVMSARVNLSIPFLLVPYGVGEIQNGRMANTEFSVLENLRKNSTLDGHNRSKT